MFNLEGGIRLSLEYSYQEFLNKVQSTKLEKFKQEYELGEFCTLNGTSESNGTDGTNGTGSNETKESETPMKKLPFLFCSECPGWICFAEKKEGDFVIPYISNIKSPQQIQGNFLKIFISNLLKIVTIK